MSVRAAAIFLACTCLINIVHGDFCSATVSGGQVQGSCFDAAVALATCGIFSALVATLSTCPSGQYCCYLAGGTTPQTTLFPGQTTTLFPGQTTLFPGQTTTQTTLFPGQTTTFIPPGQNVCGVSQQSRQLKFISPDATDMSFAPGFATADGSGIQSFIESRFSDTANFTGSRMSRILGGTTVPDLTRYCWIAAIYANGRYVASGAIVNSNWIITSGNAVKSFQSSSQQLMVVVGQTNIATGGPTGTGQFQVLGVKTYPGMRIISPGYPVGDAALLQLSSNIDFMANPSLCAACLPAASISIAGERCHAAGYGVTSETATTSDGMLRDVLLPFIPSPVCDMVYRAVLRISSYVTSTTSFCAGGERGKDTCLKDGGAPLSCISLTRPYYIVAGLSSWGSGCGRYGTPSVYTNLADPGIASWITTTAGQSFPAPFG